jgi:PIN domain nuclease of toxin-antitoxin system
VKRFLLDTHVLIWFMQGGTSLGDQVRGVIADDSSADEVFAAYPVQHLWN